MFDSLFRPRQRVIEWKGRRIICRPPTLDTLLVAFERLWLALQGCAEKEEVIRTIPEDQRVDAVCTLLGQWREAAPVLESMTGPLPELTESAELRALVFSAAASLVDLDLLLGEFDFKKAKQAESAEPSPEPQGKDRSFDDCLLRLGHLFGCSPFEIWTWPVDAALYALRNAPRALSPGMFAEEEVINGNDARPEVLQSLGIRVLSDRPPEA